MQRITEKCQDSYFSKATIRQWNILNSRVNRMTQNEQNGHVIMIHNEHHEHERALRPYRIMLHQHLPIIQNEIPTIYIHSLLHFKDVPILERFSLRRNSSSIKGLISASRPPKMALKAQTISLVNLIGIWIYIYIYTGIWIYRY